MVKGVVSKDHVHILVSCPPTMAPSEIMRRIKGRTSSKLFEEFPHVKKRYWGRHFWARGYFCATVGQMTEEMIQQYWSIILNRSQTMISIWNPDKTRHSASGSHASSLNHQVRARAAAKRIKAYCVFHNTVELALVRLLATFNPAIRVSA